MANSLVSAWPRKYGFRRGTHPVEERTPELCFRPVDPSIDEQGIKTKIRRSTLENSYSFAAIRGVQAGRAFYVVMVPLRTLERLFSFDEEELPFSLRAQRELNRQRVPAVAHYISEHPRDYVLSALSATIDGGLRFEAAQSQRSVGTLEIDMTATILLNDGQHRRAGVIEALREHPRLGDESIAVTLYPDEGLERSQQMFVDLNQHGVKPARSLRLFFDHRDDRARFSRAVVDAIPLLRDMTDFTRTNLAAGSRKLFAFSNLHSAITTLIAEAGLEVTSESSLVVVEFWRNVIDQMADWSAAGRREVAPANLRRETVHAHGVALMAIAVAGARLLSERPADWPEALRGLAKVDWSRANTQLWEGRALVGGRINRSRTSVMLTAEVIYGAFVQKGAD